MEISSIVSAQRSFFKSCATQDYSFRIKMLRRLKRCVKKYEKRIYEALKSDLNKPVFESFVSEVGIVLNEIEFAIAHLREWMKPERKPVGIVNQPAKSYVRYEPYGVTLILAPWNYPFHLTLMPLVGAIAAGNTAIIKPSEYAEASAALLKNMFDDCFDEHYIAVICGGKDVAESLLDEQFDKIFYTGSTSVGRIVMQKAARHLTPVTLELGGKSPAVVLQDAKVDLSARRILWGKLFNAGQTCVAVDYAVVESAIYEDFVSRLVAYAKRFMRMKRIRNNYARIVNKRHFYRLLGLIEKSRIIYSGGYDDKDLFIYPTIVEASAGDPVLDDEIFGPILPVVRLDGYDSIREFLLTMPDPLALYVFTESTKAKERILCDIPSGGVTVNDTLVHLSSSHLPFGGVGTSGMGTYHGYYSFLEFSHKRAVMERSTIVDVPLRYPPYSGKLPLVKRLF